MTVISGFFNSVSGDRKYDSSNFAEYFGSFVGNGIFPQPTDGLKINANNNMNIAVQAGKAWINGYFMVNDSDYTLTIENADGVLNRIDRIVARYDVTDREIRLQVKKGTFASVPVAPEIQRDSNAYELALADIYISAGSINIVQANITDLRNDSEYCGIVDSLIAGNVNLLNDRVDELYLTKFDKTADGKDITVTFTEAATEADIASGEKLSIMFGKILKKFKNIISGTTVVGKASICTGNAATTTKLQTTRQINGVNFDGTQNITIADTTKAPISHASSAITYGLGSTANYGHIKVRNDLLASAYADGEALSSYQGKLLNNKIDWTEPVLLADLTLSTSAKTLIQNYLTGAYDKYTIVLDLNFTVTTTGTSSTRSFGLMLFGSNSGISETMGSTTGVVLNGIIDATKANKTATITAKFIKEFVRCFGGYFNPDYSASSTSYTNLDGLNGDVRMVPMPLGAKYTGLYLQPSGDMSASGTLKCKIYGQNIVR